MEKDIMLNLYTLIDDAIIYIDEVFGNLKAAKDENDELNALAKHYHR